MSKTSIYLNFERDTEEAFTFYKNVFNTQFIGDINRLGDAPADPSRPLAEADKNLIMHVQIELPGGVMLHGTDAPESMGFKLNKGNNFYIMLDLDTKEIADEMFTKLSESGKIEMQMQVMFWGDYWGSFTDKYGVNWMINVAKK